MFQSTQIKGDKKDKNIIGNEVQILPLIQVNEAGDYLLERS